MHKAIFTITLACTAILPAYALEVVASSQNRATANLENKLASKLTALAALLEALGQKVEAMRNCSIQGEYYDITSKTCKTSVLGTKVAIIETDLNTLEARVDGHDTHINAAVACSRQKRSYNWHTKRCESASGNSVRKVSATKKAWRWPSASVQCASNETVVGGGGTCTASGGWMFVYKNYPYRNGWRISCDTPQSKNARATVYALCMKK